MTTNNTDKLNQVVMNSLNASSSRDNREPYLFFFLQFWPVSQQPFGQMDGQRNRQVKS